MIDFSSFPIWVGVIIIFMLRVVELSFSSLRMMMLIRDRKQLAWVFGFMQGLIFVLAISNVLSNLESWFHVIAYAAGFSTGWVVGSFVEGKLAIGFTHIRIVSSKLGTAIADKLRKEGFAVTEISARGKDGMVTLLDMGVMRKRAKDVQEIVKEVDDTAFITSEDLRPVNRGYWH
jgi:uncharacterized protein YebE (UPF0316 family)